MKPKSRILLALAVLIFGFGAAMHAYAYFAKTSWEITASNLRPLLASEFRVLWLADSTTLSAMAVVCAFLTIRPTAASGTVVALLALVPAATTALLYGFLGPFYAGHLLLVGSIMTLLAGVLKARESIATHVPMEHKS
jgi:hypothetical protein